MDCSDEKLVYVCRVSKTEDVGRLQGSKYVKSNMNDTIEWLKSDLEKCNKVFFFGTPCQCSAVKNVIGRSKNLYLVDLICHGVSPQQYLVDEVLLHCKSLNDVERLCFRSGRDFVLQLFLRDGRTFREWSGENLYYKGFFGNLSLYDGCYSCNYAQLKRVGDITLGDFWGINRTEPHIEAPKEGVSLVIINSEKGAEWFNQIVNEGVCFRRTLEEACYSNSQLKQPVPMHPKRKAFLKTYRNSGYKKAMMRFFTFEIFKYRIKMLVKRLIQRM